MNLEDVDDVLSWTARESMTNILRHSHARNAVIILSGDADLVRLRVRQAMDTGARGFMVKDRPVPELVDAIRRMAAGALIIDPDLAVSALDLTPNPLSEREREVLRASAGAPTIRALSRQLHLSASTVRNYLSAAIR
jgi:DNA-binding NarL/FixJ family response regulator